MTNAGAQQETLERPAMRLPGFPVITLLVVVGLVPVASAVTLFTSNPVVAAVLIVIPAVVVGIAVTGLFVNNPNEARVVQFFGRYIGTVRAPGLHWTVPLTYRTRVSLRVRNVETDKLKVNDSDGSPVEIAAVVVWRVVDTAKAAFAVDDFVAYVSIQSEAAVRHLATSYPYDGQDDEARVNLRDASAISDELDTELSERAELAGVEIVESRITHLAYASEIAQAMLVRQQASAVVAARARIVQGAVSMVHLALDQLTQQGVVELDEERRATMVSNLLVVLCGHQPTQPVVNAGSLYS